MLDTRISRYSPIISRRINKLPDKLIYQQETSADGLYKFIMFSTKPEDKTTTQMICFPSVVNRKGQKNIPSLYIWKLYSTKSDRGFGTAMLDFAKVLSRRLGCCGRFHLSADPGWFPNRVPHIFYRKYGMTTDNEYFDRRLDKLIKKGKNANHLQFGTMNMFYPPMEKEKPAGLLNKILRIFKFDVK